ncbi:MAG: hypothetical protein COZ07_10050 [Candidatus Infernicultor aquiphilus]|uniref:Uncharacterized protein n=1 Tax=Candidatus Infernicultor aquiphilus TaxID=1805029 RepID=A0A2M7K8W4_9BACT|nr:MAG: hypothetical protein COT11_04455 [Candidatus Atribacteria bacterium CG08_land_8_20_14_0_20_33_29]PIW12565.1 MAG: hypothetical protein COW35_00745 [Candidatus Atribacteria bacterium CG17_big_fil_post_rev_8_21_14_2_50_34_11]PIX34586.1 MAG: hypothetical protein COZ58_03400 [Candidatus Atribacteria bacterium CG_4_8_14_3_um_filter_34_18]PIY31215.1 MAG: hypothetical protein COZ07_10050 [Candidatus Atribacteria bacterium CG_4_10_14_3_um_filter_34_13]
MLYTLEDLELISDREIFFKIIYPLRYNNEKLDKTAIIRYSNERRKDEKRFEVKIYEENT